MLNKKFRIVVVILLGLTGIILIGFGIYLYLYYPRTAQAFEINTPDPKQKILIATQSTEFKDQFVNRLCDSLKNSGISFKGIDVGDFSAIESNEWDRILIITSFIIWLNSDADEFIKNETVPEKILLFVTSGGDDWQPEPELQIDAITSASRSQYTDYFVQLMADWLSKDTDSAWVPNDYLLTLKFSVRADVETACLAIAADEVRYRNNYPNLVNLINQIGYQYLRLEKVSSAIEIFKLNVRLFPEVWNVYDSYGEALMKNGDISQAKINYEKALELNPGRNSITEILEELNE
jgi:tetratricopeptide (TPR) repeat protein